MTYQTDYIGKPTNRVDGPAKVAGTAKYAAEFSVPNLLYGYVVSSPITEGKITKIDAAPVLALPGVQQVFSHENVPHYAFLDKSYKDQIAPGGSPFRPLHDAEIKCSPWRWWWPIPSSWPATPRLSCTSSTRRPPTKLS